LKMQTYNREVVAHHEDLGETEWLQNKKPLKGRMPSSNKMKLNQLRIGLAVLLLEVGVSQAMKMLVEVPGEGTGLDLVQEVVLGRHQESLKGRSKSQKGHGETG
jgi:hypothetical protein